MHYLSNALFLVHKPSLFDDLKFPFLIVPTRYTISLSAFTWPRDITKHLMSKKNCLLNNMCYITTWNQTCRKLFQHDSKSRQAYFISIIDRGLLVEKELDHVRAARLACQLQGRQPILKHCILKLLKITISFQNIILFYDTHQFLNTDEYFSQPSYPWTNLNQKYAYRARGTLS